MDSYTISLGISQVLFRKPVTGQEFFLLFFSYSKSTGSRVPSVKSYLIQSINLYFELEKNALLLGGSGHQSCNDGYMLLSVIKGKPSKAKDNFFKKTHPIVFTYFVQYPKSMGRKVYYI